MDVIVTKNGGQFNFLIFTVIFVKSILGKQAQNCLEGLLLWAKNISQAGCICWEKSQFNGNFAQAPEDRCVMWDFQEGPFKGPGAEINENIDCVARISVERESIIFEGPGIEKFHSRSNA